MSVALTFKLCWGGFLSVALPFVKYMRLDKNSQQKAATEEKVVDGFSEADRTKMTEASLHELAGSECGPPAAKSRKISHFSYF